MPTDKNVLTLPEFVNLIKALELTNVIFQHQKVGKTNNKYKQLPNEVTNAFLKLDYSINSRDKHLYNTNEAFSNFMNQLVKFARFNSGRYPTTEKAHAEFLLGLLLHYKIEINFGTITHSISHIMCHKLSPMEQTRCHGRDMDSDDYYYCKFLSEAWRESQPYPRIEAINDAWQSHLRQQEQASQEKLRQERVAAHQAVLQQQYLAQKAYHHFEGTVFNFEKFSYVLEGFIRSDLVRLAIDNHLGKSALEMTTTQLILLFSNQARSTLTDFHQNEIGLTFVKLMKEIIAKAKSNDKACGILLGFLLYHDFTLYHGNERFRISDIVKAEMTLQDKCAFQCFGESAFPFFNRNWQQAQNYPGRVDLEQVLAPIYTSTPRAKPFLPGSFQGYVAKENTQQQNTHQMNMECEFAIPSVKPN